VNRSVVFKCQTSLLGFALNHAYEVWPVVDEAVSISRAHVD
jgi:hypothetical protein